MAPQDFYILCLRALEHVCESRVLQFCSEKRGGIRVVVYICVCGSFEGPGGGGKRNEAYKNYLK